MRRASEAGSHVEEVEEQQQRARKKAKKAGKELSVEEAQLLAAAAEDEEAAMKEQARLREIPRELAVYEITGPLFFGAADRINQIETREETKMPGSSYACCSGS